jgi:hypothetical protein
MLQLIVFFPEPIFLLKDLFHSSLELPDLMLTLPDFLQKQLPFAT